MLHVDLLTHHFPLWITRQMPIMHKVLTLVKIKHRVSESWLNPCLVYISSLGRRRIELTGKNMGTRGRARCFYLFCIRLGSDRCVRSDQLPVRAVKNEKKLSLSRKITIFSEEFAAAMLTLAKILSHQVWAGRLPALLPHFLAGYHFYHDLNRDVVLK